MVFDDKLEIQHPTTIVRLMQEHLDRLCKAGSLKQVRWRLLLKEMSIHFNIPAFPNSPITHAEHRERLDWVQAKKVELFSDGFAIESNCRPDYADMHDWIMEETQECTESFVAELHELLAIAAFWEWAFMPDQNGTASSG